MNKIIFCVLVMVTSTLFAQESETPVLNNERHIDDSPKKFKARDHHWLVTVGGEGLNYKVPFEYDGLKKDISPDYQELWGGRLGIGGEIYLGAGFNISTKIEGFYVGTLFTRAITADPEVDDIEIASTKQTGQVYGGDLVQTFGYLYDFKTKNPFLDQMTYLTLEPFVEVGIGYAQAYNRLDYNYNTGAANVQEYYRTTVEDGLTNQRVGGGVNILSREGFYFYVKATLNRYDITKRKIKGAEKVDDGAFTPIDEDINDAKINPITVYAIGGGYKF